MGANDSADKDKERRHNWLSSASFNICTRTTKSYCYVNDAHSEIYYKYVYTHTYRYIWPGFCVDEILRQVQRLS